MVGAGAYKQFDGLQVGSKLKFRGSYWSVVGVFETKDAHDSELWADLDTVQSAFGRTGVSSVVVKLNYAKAFDDLKRRLTADPQLTVDVKTEQDYFSSQSSGLTSQIGFLTNIVAYIMAFGALFGALNTMYSAVSSRTAEIGTLRALGFGNAPVVASVMAEAMALSLLGGILGSAIAYFVFNDYSVSTLGGGFTQVAFNSKV
jgi:putative ABC transport system permease protein